MHPFEEITVSYGSNYFIDGRLKSRCPHKDKHIVSPGNPQESFTSPVVGPLLKCTKLPATPIDLFRSSTEKNGSPNCPTEKVDISNGIFHFFPYYILKNS